MTLELHSHYMQRALTLAELGLTTTMPNPRVGCVLVKNNVIIAEGWHQRAGGAHAEIHALQQAGEAAQGAICYVSLEPCVHQGRTGPCVQALISAGISNVIIAMPDPNPLVAGRGIEQLRAAGIDVEVGVLAESAAQLNRGFIKRMQTGLPWVRAKQAMSLDGRIALANGESQWLTGEIARHDNQQLRARSCAIMTGIETVLTDNPSLNVRLHATERQPWRVIVDSHLRCPPDAKILQLPGKVLLATANADEQHQQLFDQTQVEILTLPDSATGKVDLRRLLQCLAERGCNEIHLEAGSRLTGAYMQLGLIDELILYMAPMLLGPDAQALMQLPLLTSLEKAPLLHISTLTPLGKDVKIALIVNH